jgi:hypothetical protein
MIAHKLPGRPKMGLSLPRMASGQSDNTRGRLDTCTKNSHWLDGWTSWTEKRRIQTIRPDNSRASRQSQAIKQPYIRQTDKRASRIRKIEVETTFLSA